MSCHMDLCQVDGPLPVPVGSPRTAVRLLECEFERRTLTALRERVRACLAAQGVTDATGMRLMLAVDEVVMNAVRHGGGRGRLEMQRAADELWCRISDDGPGIPARYRTCRPQPPVDEVSGRRIGLWMAAQICADVGISDGALGGAVVVLRHPVPA